MDRGVARLVVARVLMVAFHFPPQSGSSGLQRTLKFVHYLPRHGWQPLVLSAHPRAYDSRSDDQLSQIAPGTVVRRAFAFNSARHLAWRGRYLGALALPDRWISWLPGAVLAGWRLLRRERAHVIWSTYPIATAHLIGLALHRLSGLPWVADMRDPMHDESYPPPGPMRRAHQWVEALTVRHASRVVCTTPGAVALYRQRFPAIDPARFVLIENGYDEEAFAAAEALARPLAPVAGRALRLLHSGVVYPSERDPGALFAALAQLRAAGTISAASVQLVLRAPGHEATLAALIAQHGVGELVTLAPPLPYRAALAEMLEADGLLVLQAANCNAQIPAKLYEYLRARRPLLGLTDAHGDTAGALRAAGVERIAPLDDPAAIAAALSAFIADLAAGTAALPTAQNVASHARQARAAQLAALLDALAAGRTQTVASSKAP